MVMIWVSFPSCLQRVYNYNRVAYFPRADPVWHLIALLTWLVDFAERLVRACVLWEGSLAVRNAHNSMETPQGKDQGVKVKLELIEVDRDNLFDGDLCATADCLILRLLC